jgi:hypothetical protein
MMPAGVWSTSSAGKVRWKFSHNMIQIITGQSEESQRRREHAPGCLKYLKPDGRIIVLNLPHRGNRLLFSDKGLKDNRQFYGIFRKTQF